MGNSEQDTVFKEEEPCQLCVPNLWALGSSDVVKVQCTINSETTS